MVGYQDNTVADELALSLGDPGSAHLQSRTATGAAASPSLPPPRLKSEKYCGFGSIVGSLPDKSEMLTIPLRCGSWGCKYCAPRKCRAIVARLLRGKPQRDITLTLRVAPPFSPYLLAKKIKRAWAKLSQKARRVFGIFEYALVFELTKASVPHVHVLQRGTYIPHAWLKREWNRLTGSYIVHIQKIDSASHAALHAVKYLGKQFGQTALALAPLHLVQFSKGYDLKDPEPKTENKCAGYLWVHTREDADDIAQRFLDSPRYISHVCNPDGSWAFTMKPITLPELADASHADYILRSGDSGPPAIDVPPDFPLPAAA